jgi:hypothetical protein
LLLRLVGSGPVESSASLGGLVFTVNIELELQRENGTEYSEEMEIVQSDKYNINSGH